MVVLAPRRCTHDPVSCGQVLLGHALHFLFMFFVAVPDAAYLACRDPLRLFGPQSWAWWLAPRISGYGDRAGARRPGAEGEQPVKLGAVQCTSLRR